MADDPTNMRDRIAESATQWALMYPLANWGFWGFAKGEARDQIAAVAEDLAAAWGRDIADRVLAELFTATDPGGDLHRQTVKHLGQAWPDLTEDPVYLDQLAHEALSVRWEHAVRQAVEVERLRAESQAMALRVAGAEAERDAYAATIEKSAADALAHRYCAMRETGLLHRARRAEAERDEAVKRAEFAENLNRDISSQDQREAEAAIERVRALHTQGVMPDMCKECNHVPAADCPTLRALDTPAPPKGDTPCAHCGGAGAEPGTEEWNDIAHMHDPHTGDPCSVCHGKGSHDPDTTGEPTP